MKKIYYMIADNNERWIEKANKLLPNDLSLDTWHEIELDCFFNTEEEAKKAKRELLAYYSRFIGSDIDWIRDNNKNRMEKLINSSIVKVEIEINISEV